MTKERPQVLADISNRHVAANHFADVGKMVRYVGGASISGRYWRAGCHLKRAQLMRAALVDATVSQRYCRQHIRPMAVRPLVHPERWPTPWGFLFSEPRSLRVSPLHRRPS